MEIRCRFCRNLFEGRQVTKISVGFCRSPEADFFAVVSTFLQLRCRTCLHVYVSPIKLTRRPPPPLVVSTERWDFENLYRKEWVLALWALTKKPWVLAPTSDSKVLYHFVRWQLSSWFQSCRSSRGLIFRSCRFTSPFWGPFCKDTTGQNSQNS